jgi:hypothetical protein
MINTAGPTEYDKFCDGRECISTDEFNAWMGANGLIWSVVYRDEDESRPCKSMVTISHHGNLNPQTVRVGLLALSMIVRMARYVFGCAQSIAEERSHDYRDYKLRRNS